LNLKENGLNILIRTSGGRAPKEELGMGHVYRCLNLVSSLKFNTINFLLEDYGDAKKVIKLRGFRNIKVLKKGINLKEDIKITKNFIQKKKIDLVIVDKYHVKTQYLKEIKKITKLVVIADLYNINFPADLVVNGFIGFKNTIKKNSLGSKCLLGPRYQIINKKFSEKLKKSKPKYDLLITVGGFDEKNIIDVFLKSVLPYISQIKIKIIMGPTGKKSKLTRILEKQYPTHLKIIKSTKNMNKEISSARYGICSGGITSYEFASMKKLFAIICHVRHQLSTATEWEKKGIAMNFGIVSKNTENKIKKFLQQIIRRNEPYKMKNRNFVDGKGSMRVSQEILKIR